MNPKGEQPRNAEKEMRCGTLENGKFPVYAMTRIPQFQYLAIHVDFQLSLLSLRNEHFSSNKTIVFASVNPIFSIRFATFSARNNAEKFSAKSRFPRQGGVSCRSANDEGVRDADNLSFKSATNCDEECRSCCNLISEGMPHEGHHESQTSTGGGRFHLAEKALAMTRMRQYELHSIHHGMLQNVGQGAFQ